MAQWEVDIRPEGEENPSEKGRNENALIVQLVREAGDGEDKQVAEVARVLYVRRNSKNPRTTFKASLRRTLETAYAARDALNGTDGDLAVLRREAEEKRKAMEDAERKRDEALARKRNADREKVAGINQGQV